jgi:hypothetical protein
MTTAKRVKLRGVLAQTVSWAAIDDDENVVIELYDFSAEAHRWLGNDVAFLLRLDPAAKDEASKRLLPDGGAASVSERDDLLLRAIQARFDDYYAVLEWLEEQAIPFRKEFEPWA